MTVADLIGFRQDVYSIRSGSTVHEAARYLRDKRLRVVDASGRLVGVLSQSDICETVVAENQCPARIRVDDIMTTAFVTVRADSSIDACLGLLQQHGRHHLPVIGPAGTFQGMVSVTDLLQTVMSEEKSRADLLESFINSH